MSVPRALAALALAAVALAAALYLHGYRESRRIDLRGLTSYGSAFVPPPAVSVPAKPAWGDPAAVLVVAVGAGGAVAVLRRKRARLT